MTGAVYVGAGIGASVMPFRIGERGKREITVFEFGRRPGEFEEPDCEQAPLAGRAPSLRKMRRRAEKVIRRRTRRSLRRTVEMDSVSFLCSFYRAESSTSSAAIWRARSTSPLASEMAPTAG